jgi:hypothetical protein
MQALRKPDWCELIGTGLWGLGFRLRSNRGLVLLSSGSDMPSENPDRLWPFILTQDKKRNIGAEELVAKRTECVPLLERHTVGKEEILCVREKNLNDLLSLLSKQSVKNVANS